MGRVNSAEVRSGELWSTNSGVYCDGLATIYAPNARNVKMCLCVTRRISTLLHGPGCNLEE